MCSLASQALGALRDATPAALQPKVAALPGVLRFGEGFKAALEPPPHAAADVLRVSSAPAALRNIAGGTPSPSGSVLVAKGKWRLSLALGDFLLGSKLGEGLTGRVHYAKLKVRGAECALKVMRKAKLVELGEEHHVRSELEALGRISSPFVTALLGCFQDVHAVYLAIEYMRGPDLFAYM